MVVGRKNLRIIAKKKLRDYWLANTQAKLPLIECYFKMKACEATHFSILRRHFNSADYVSGYTIFNVGGNHYRLITAIHYETQRCYIRDIWTHAQYSKRYNQDKLKKGEL